MSNQGRRAWWVAAAVVAAGCGFDIGGAVTGLQDAAAPGAADAVAPASDAASSIADAAPSAPDAPIPEADAAASSPDAAAPTVDAAVPAIDAAPPDGPDAGLMCEPRAVDCADPLCDGAACGAGCVCEDGAGAETACSDGDDNDDDGAPDCRDGDCPGCPALFGCCPDGTCRLLTLGC